MYIFECLERNIVVVLWGLIWFGTLELFKLMGFDSDDSILESFTPKSSNHAIDQSLFCAAWNGVNSLLAKVSFLTRENSERLSNFTIYASPT